MRRFSERCVWTLMPMAMWGMTTACGSTATPSTGDAAGSDLVVADSAAVVDAAIDTPVATDVGGDLADSGADAAVDAAETAQDVLPDVDGGAADTAIESDVTDAAEVDGTQEDGSAAIDCQAVLSTLQAEIAKLSTGHVACAHDADCTTVPTSTGCQGTCGVGLNTQSVPGFATALAALDAKYCEKTDFTKFCGYSTPKCMAPAPGCVDGICVYKK